MADPDNNGNPQSEEEKRIKKAKEDAEKEAWKQASNLASKAGKIFAQSAFGDTAANYMEKTISSAFSGAQLGGAIAPGIGHAVGALVGVLAGVIESSLEEFEKEDKRFKNYVSNSYNSILDGRTEMTQKGLKLANLSDEELKQENHVDQFALAKGRGYKKAKDASLDKQDEFYQSEDGLEIQEVYRMAGQKEAELEDLKQTSIQNAQKAVLQNKDFKEAKDNGDIFTMTRLLDEAAIQAEIDYQNSKDFQNMEKSKALIAQDIQDMVFENQSLYAKSDAETNLETGKLSVQIRNAEKNKKDYSTLSSYTTGNSPPQNSSANAYLGYTPTPNTGNKTNDNLDHIGTSSDSMVNEQKRTNELLLNAQKVQKFGEIIVNVQLSGIQDSEKISKEVSTSLVTQRNIS